MMNASILFQEHPDPMWFYDPETRRLLAVNDAAALTYGHSVALDRDMCLLGPCPETEARRLTNTLRHIDPSLGDLGLWRLTRHDGVVVHSAIRAQPVDFEGKPAILVCGRDASAFLALESRRRDVMGAPPHEAVIFETVVGSAILPGPGQFLVVKPDTFRIVEVCDSFLDEMRLSRDDVVGTLLFELYFNTALTPEPIADLGAADALGEALGRVHRSGRAEVVTVQRRPAEPGQEDSQQQSYWGTLIAPVKTKVGQVDLLVLRTDDISQDVLDTLLQNAQNAGLGTLETQAALNVLAVAEQKLQAAERLTRSEAALRDAQRIGNIGSWRLDQTTGQLEWSDQLYAIFGIERAAFSNTFEAFLERVHPDDRTRLKDARAASFETGERVDITFRIVRPDGSVRVVREIKDGYPDRAPRKLSGVIQDVTELVAAQSKADELSTRLFETLENIGDAFFTLDRDWTFTYLNSQAEVLLGRQRHKLIWRKILEEFPEVAGTEYETQFIRAFETGQTVRFEQVFPRRNRTFRVNAHPTRNGLAVYFSDISKERHRDEQLRLLESAVARINDIVIITEADESDKANNATIVYVNDAFERLTGYTRGEVIGRTPRILQGPKTQRAELDRIRKAVDGSMPVRAELINYAKSGREYWLEIDVVPIANEAGQVTHFVSIQRDTTERRRAEEALRVSEARFRLIARATGRSVWEWDIASGDWWVDGLTEVFGHSPDPERATLAMWRANVSRDDEHRFDQAIDALLSGETDAFVARYEFRRGDGSWASVEDRTFAIRDDEGRVVRILGSMTDISDRLQMEDKLRQSQKLEAIGQLTGGVAHDFNNLLTIILGNVETLQDELAEEHPLRRFADMSALAAERAAELTNRLLSFSRKQALEPQVIDLNAVVAGIEGMMRRTLGEDMDIEIVCAEGLWQTEADIGQLEAALLNLVINSRDAMPDGGELTIQTENASLDEAHVATEPELQPGQYVIVAVSDTGHGIAREHIDRVFEPFFTTKGLGQGTGLGLSMVYGFVKQTGGHITISSKPTQGTTVRLYFPRFDRKQAPPGAGSATRQPPRGQETILVVEDDTLILQQVTKQLEGLGYRVFAASAGEPALAILRDRPDIDLLFTDVVLPGRLNGRQIADAARKIRPELKVLFTSGYSEDAIIHDGRLDSGVDLLNKPYRRMMLATKVRQVLDRG